MHSLLHAALLRLNDACKKLFREFHELFYGCDVVLIHFVVSSQTHTRCELCVFDNLGVRAPRLLPRRKRRGLEGLA